MSGGRIKDVGTLRSTFGRKDPALLAAHIDRVGTRLNETREIPHNPFGQRLIPVGSRQVKRCRFKGAIGRR